MRLLAFVASTLALMACGASSTPGPTHAGASVQAAPDPLTAALFAARPEHRELRDDHWGRHIALVADGQVYASNGDDLPTMVGAALYGVLAARRPAEALRCATIGLGSAVEAATLAGLGCGRVDVFERREALFDNARELVSWYDARLAPRGAEAPFHVLTEPPEEGARYDVIVQAVGTTLLDRPFRLFTVERFEALARLLADDGVFVQHIQLYEIHADTHQRLLRTMAEAFPQLYAVSPDALSSDLLVLASARPIRLDLGRLARWREEPSTARFVSAALLDSDYAPIARAVFSSRADVLRYTSTPRPGDADATEGPAQPYTVADPLAEARMPLRPPIAPPDGWDPEFEAEWSAASEAFTASFGENLVETVHAPDWDYGGACLTALDECVAAGDLGESASPEASAEWLYALMEADRLPQATDALERLMTRGVVLPRVLSTLMLLTNPGAHMPAFDPLRPFPSGGDTALVDRAKAAWLARAADPGAALSQLRVLTTQTEVSPALQVGRAMLTLLSEPEDAYGMYGDLREMSETSEGAAWLEAHPEAWCYLGWVALQDVRSEEATRAMRRCAELPEAEQSVQGG